MKKYFIYFFVIVFTCTAYSEVITYDDSWGQAGFTLEQSGPTGVEVNFSIDEFTLDEVVINNENMQNVILPGVFLPNDEGAPDLPGNGRFIAIPQGSTAELRIISSRTETFSNIELAPAPRIPLETEDGPLEFNKDNSIYMRDAYYPENPVLLSEKTQIRGVDVVTLGITPFQYNPVTKELVVYRDLQVEVNFIGGNGHFGEDRLRSRWWDPMLRDMLLNEQSLAEMTYTLNNNRTREGAEYLVICPDDPIFIAWADSIKAFRTKQGILTVVKTITEVGGNNATVIENYINDIMNPSTGWDPAPAAILLVGDYGTTGNTIVSPIYNSYCASDNIYADVSGNHMPDVILARMTAQNETHLQTMITKFLNYERTPPTNPDFYDHPVTALGWQTERWFQICSESVGGFWANELGKNQVRINAIYSGNPNVDPWSTATNTATVVNYFGPDGLGYIPASPSELGGWTGGNATIVNNAINSGAFMLQHRDHGSETGWGEPAYSSSNINSLTNSDLVFVWSINCLTGKFNMTGECFAEKFHRHTYNGENAGALAIVAASEISYSFVNDTYVWGAYDNMWTDFMPDYGTTPESRDILPAFGNAAGKYFLQQSNWPYNTGNKAVTYNLFHHHGDAFSTVYSEMPQNLTIVHDPVLLSALDYFTIIADIGSLIGLTVDGELIGVGQGTGVPLDIPIIQQLPGEVIEVTVTKQNYYRYTALVDVIPPAGPYVLFDSYTLDDSAGNGNGLMDYGESILLTISVENVGIDQADNVTINLSTDDQYITITDSTEFYGNIAAGIIVTVDDGFAVEVCDSIPDEHMFLFELNATDGTSTWTSNFVIEAYAPVLSAGEMLIDDATGNNNGVLDPGETVIITIPTYNDGHAISPEAIATLFCSNQLITIEEGTINLGEINSLSFVDAIFTVTADDDIVFGTPITFNYNVVAGEYIVSRNYETTVGVFIEDFESGGFTNYPWEFIGCNITWPNVNPIEDFTIIDTIPDVNWSIATDDFYSGLASAKSANITHNQASFMDVTLDVTVDGEISFYYRVACEYSPSQTYFYDGLIFFIDDQEQGRYQPESDGSTPWTFASYPVTTGTHTFSWVYVKDSSDGSTSMPEDCVWVDYIVFPTITPGAVGTLAGQVTLLPPGNVEDVLISIGSTTTNPNIFGTYSIDIPAGIYDVVATLDGYETITVYDVVIISDQTTYVDFVLTYLAAPINLEGELAGCYVTLDWEQSGTDNSREFSHYNIYRNVDEGAFSLLDTTLVFAYVDSLSETGDYGYYVTAMYAQNNQSNPTETIIIEYLQTDTENELIPVATTLNGNYPNPFNPETTIKFNLKENSKVTIEIYNIKGQKVKTLMNDVKNAGYHSVIWDGKDDKGKNVTSGIFLYRMKADKYSSTRKMILLK